MTFADNLRRVVVRAAKSESYRRPDEAPKADDAEVILAIAAAMADADGQLFEEEAAAFRVLADAVCRATKAPPLQDDPRAYLPEDGTKTLDHVALLASKLTTRGAKELAYKAAIAIAISDLAAHRAEGDVDEALVAAFGFTPDEADALTAEVHEMLGGGEDE